MVTRRSIDSSAEYLLDKSTTPPWISVQIETDTEQTLFIFGKCSIYKIVTLATAETNLETSMQLEY